MTTGEPSGGIAEPEPDRGDNSPPANTASPPPHGVTAGGDPGTGAPQTPQPQGPPVGTGETPPNESWAALWAAQHGVDPSDSPRKRNRKLVLWFGSLLCAALTTYFVIWPVGSSSEHKAQKKNDIAESPFSVSMEPETSEPREWAMVLDRELSASEARKMKSLKESAAFSYLKSLGGRQLTYAPMLEHAPKRFQEEQIADGMELADVFKLNILSLRDKSVVITRWEVVDLHCEPSPAKTVVAFPPQGGEPYQGIRLHLPPRADEPVLTDNAEGQGEPYFGRGRIEVGNGQVSAGLRVEAIATAGQACIWGVRVRYTDAYQKSKRVRLEDSDGAPLVMHTESVPTNPRQKWVSGSVPWTACHEKPEEAICKL